jgi:hypothetical protein
LARQSAHNAARSCRRMRHRIREPDYVAVSNMTPMIKQSGPELPTDSINGSLSRVRSCTTVLIETARIESAVQTEFVPKKENPGSLSNVQSGDVLVSHPTAVREHEISIVPNAPHAMSPTHDVAVSVARSEAEASGVDAWLTEIRRTS